MGLRQALPFLGDSLPTEQTMTWEATCSDFAVEKHIPEKARSWSGQELSTGLGPPSAQSLMEVPGDSQMARQTNLATVTTAYCSQPDRNDQGEGTWAVVNQTETGHRRQIKTRGGSHP